MKTYVITNQKGGVGKSTVAVHKAFYRAQKGERVLFIDTDGQANSSTTLEGRATVGYDAFDIFKGEAEINLTCEKGEIVLLRGTPELNEVERFNNDVVVHMRDLSKALADKFDVCVIDTPPTLGLRLISSLVAADYALTPLDLGGYSKQGVRQMLQVIEQVRGNPNLNPELRFLGLLINKVNSNSPGQKETMAEMFKQFGGHIIKQPLVNRTSVQEAVDASMPVWEMKKTSARIAGKEWKQAMALIEQLAEQ